MFQVDYLKFLLKEDKKKGNPKFELLHSEALRENIPELLNYFCLFPFLKSYCRQQNFFNF